MSFQPDTAPAGADSADLSRLAWVHEELRRSLDLAHKALRRHLKEAAAIEGSDVDAVEPGVLRQARAQLHQGVGALDMVGQQAPARVLRASEAALAKLGSRSHRLTAAAVDTLEFASFAVLDYLQRLLAGKPESPLGLFPQYRAVQELAGADRVHPADLWPLDWRWRELPSDPSAHPRQADAQTRSAVESRMLALMRQPDGPAAQQMSDLFAGLGAGARDMHLSTLWKLAGAFFEGQAQRLLKPDVYTKRVVSRLLAQLRLGERGGLEAEAQGEVSERLAQDLLFFCAQAVQPADRRAAPRLAAVRQGWGLGPAPALAAADYQSSRLGRFDPAWLAQAQKRVAGAKDAWSAVAGGELHRLAGLTEQFALVGDSLRRLYPSGDKLADALHDAVAQTVESGVAPPAELAMEVATGVLFLEASLEDAEFDHPEQAERVQHLAQRIETVRRGQHAEPLAGWMEELYRRVSERQTMGSVVHELRASLSESEKIIDQYFRDPRRRELLIPVPNQLQAMRGVLSVLGLEQAAHAVVRMRDDVDVLAQTEVDPQQPAAAESFEKLAANLGTLGFLIDLLSVQPALAKQLFVFDAEAGTLRSVMEADAPAEPAEPAPLPEPELLEHAQSLGFSAAHPDVPFEHISLELERLSDEAVAADLPVLAQTVTLAQSALRGAADDGARQAARNDLAEAMAEFVTSRYSTEPLPREAPEALPLPDTIDDDAEIREIFLEEAREVLQAANAAVAALDLARDDIGELTALRRAFHTLKGSGRMVGLNAFGEAAWAGEQLYNSRLAEAPRADDTLLGVTADTLAYLGDWVDCIAGSRDGGHEARAVQRVADALREFGQRLPLPLPSTAGAAEPAVPGAAPSGFETVSGPVPLIDFELDDIAAPAHDFTLVEPAAAPRRAGSLRPPTQPDTSWGALPDAAPLALPMSLPLLQEPGRPEPADAEFDEISGPVPLIDFELEEAGHTIDTTVLLEPKLAPRPTVERLPSGLAPPVPSEPVSLRHVLPDVVFDFDLDAAEPALAGPTGPGELPLLEGLPEAELPPLPQAPEAVAPAHELPVVDIAELIDFDLELPPSDPESDHFKLVGPLSVPIPLFNIFLNEADEQSRRLGTELAEWACETYRPVGETAAALAHSLAGNSATVGFTELSQLARALEHALLRSHAIGRGDALEAALFVDAADEIRALLHQFAAGFLKSPPPELLERLHEHERLSGERLNQLASAFEALDSGSGTLPGGFEDLRFDTDEAAAVPVPPAEPEEAAADDDSRSAPLAGTAFGELSGVDLKAFEPLPGPELPRVLASADALDDEDDIDAIDAVDAELFPIFEEEAQELLPQLAGRLRDWARQPHDAAGASACMRTLHTLKGGARLAGAMRLGEMAHRLETAIEHLLARGHADAAAVEALQGRVDALDANFEALRRREIAAEPAADMAFHDAPLAAPGPQEAHDVSAPVAAEDAVEHALAPLPPNEAAPPVFAAAARPQPPLQPIDWTRFAQPAEAPAHVAQRPAPGASQAAVRVRAPLLDRLVNHAGEVSITRARIETDVGQIKGSLADLSDNLERLRHQLRDLEMQADMQISSRMEAAKAAASFDPLEMDRFTRFQELTRMMAESVNDVATVQRNLQRSLQSAEDELAAQARLTRDMQDDLLRTRMVEFESIADRLYRVVRQASKETGKQVRLDIVGGAIEVDRGVLDRVTGAFEHLLRNGVVHGIECAELRAARGKDATGQITVALTHEGNEVGVEVRDDGGGLDLLGIHERAVALGVMPPGTSASDAELANLIFVPGLTTAREVTELAGRGVGMDVVRSEVVAMGGRIETGTSWGQGTSFRLLLPLTTAVTQVVMLRAGRLTVAVPSTLVETVRRATPAEVEQAYANGHTPVGEKLLPFFWLGALLQAGGRSAEAGRTLPMVVIRSAQQRVVLHVDEVLGNQEVVVKNLGPQLSRLPGLVGVTLLASGTPALIYNPVALATLYGDAAWAASRESAAVPLPAASPVDAPLAPLVLVVDDSLTVRRVTQRLLVREGYRVTLAKDGLEGLEKLAEERPAVVLSDIEMPRMDGFDLVRNLRADSRLADLPVIMITSRIAQKHRDYAAELGVNHYLGKPYSEEDLLALVAGYAGAAQLA